MITMNSVAGGTKFRVQRYTVIWADEKEELDFRISFITMLNQCLPFAFFKA